MRADAAAPSASAYTSQAVDVTGLPVVVGILVQKIADGPTPGTRMSARDRLQTYVMKESQGVMTLRQTAALNVILERLGVNPVYAPEAASVGTAAEMLAEHRQIAPQWNGTRYEPVSPALRSARERSLDDVMAHVAGLRVDATTLTSEEQKTLRLILATAVRDLI